MPSKTITLTTDFGHQDTLVGQMKGRVLSIAPDAILVDLTHEVPPQDIETGAFLLQTGYGVFPRGTVHVAVVDPGVGTARRPLIVRTERFYFVAPDNGLLTRVLDEEPALTAYVIEASHYLPERISPTFHGRDVFAAAAGWLARGIEPANFGPPAGELLRIPVHPSTLVPGAAVRARVVHIDRFGNAAVDLRRSAVEPVVGERGAGLRLVAPRGEAAGLRRTYEEGAGAGAFLVFNSADFLEVACYRGSAAERLGLRLGQEVEIRIPG
jgi:hypothetical protein